MSAAKKIKYGVTTATMGGVTKTGIFTWTGSSWRTAKLGELVRELPAGADLAAEYKKFIREMKILKTMTA